MHDSNVIVIGRCTHDQQVTYLYCWAKKVINKARKKGWRIIDLKKDRFDKKNLENSLNEENSFFFFGNGHGEDNTIRGHNNQIVMEACKNDNITAEKIVYSVSCKSGRILGQSAINKGCNFFIGYDENFSIYVQNPVPKNLLKDKFAKAFMDASNQIPICIIKGMEPQEAWIKSQRVFDKWIKKWRKRNIPEAPQIIQNLIHNKNHQLFLRR